MESQPVSRISEAEKAVIKATFKDNTPLLQLLRKVFLPEYDITAPIGHQVDLWLTLGVENMVPDVAYTNILARNMLIKHLEMCLQALQIMAQQEDLTDEQKAAQAKANSSQ